MNNDIMIVFVTCPYLGNLTVWIFYGIIFALLFVAAVVSFWGTWATTWKVAILMGVLAFWHWAPYDGLYEGYDQLFCRPGRYRIMPIPGFGMSLAFLLLAIAFNVWDTQLKALRTVDRLVRYNTWCLMVLFFVVTWLTAVTEGVTKSEIGLFLMLLAFFFVLGTLAWGWKKHNLDGWFLRRVFAVLLVGVMGAFILF